MYLPLFTDTLVKILKLVPNRCMMLEVEGTSDDVVQFSFFQILAGDAKSDLPEVALLR